MNNREMITVGNLPHWYVPGAPHFVTFRLAGTLPNQAFTALKEKKEKLFDKPIPAGMTPGQYRGNIHKQLFADYDRFLDEPGSIDWLSRPDVAALMRRALYFHNGKKYHLFSYCIMPNHVHALLQPIVAERLPTADDWSGECGEQADDSSPLSGIMHSLKSYTANEANKLLKRSGQFWQHESYDHWVRDHDEFECIVRYINWNPVNAGRIDKPHRWYFGSSHDRYLHDGAEEGCLPLV